MVCGRSTALISSLLTLSPHLHSPAAVQEPPKAVLVRDQQAAQSGAAAKRASRVRAGRAPGRGSGRPTPRLRSELEEADRAATRMLTDSKWSRQQMRLQANEAKAWRSSRRRSIARLALELVQQGEGLPSRERSYGRSQRGPAAGTPISLAGCRLSLLLLPRARRRLLLSSTQCSSMQSPGHRGPLTTRLRWSCPRVSSGRSA